MPSLQPPTAFYISQLLPGPACLLCPRQWICDPLDEHIWTGGYGFDLNVGPEVPRIGWRCGYGRWSKNLVAGRVDIILGQPEDAKKANVHGNHLRFDFLPDSTAFYIRVSNPCKVDAAWVNGDKRDRVLDLPCHVITIGEFNYEFNYCPRSDIEENKFVTRREQYVMNKLQMELPMAFASATPSVQDVQIGQWRLLKDIGRGTESVVVAAISPQGTLVAVKTLRANKRAVEKESESARYRRIRDRTAEQEGNEFVITFRDSIASGEGLGNTYILFGSVARADLTSLLDSTRNVDRAILLSLFLQTIKGIGALHAAGFIHRDVKPANIGVCSLDPPRALILDLGTTIESADIGLTPTPGQVGIIGYIAPEMEKVNFRHGPLVDIWALDCVGMQLLVDRFLSPWLPWSGTSSRQYFNPWRSLSTYTRDLIPDESELDKQRRKYRTVLRSFAHSNNPLEQILLRMLAGGPHYRPALSESLVLFQELPRLY
ncbi:hypothetical protein LTR54_017603 [Friedmanniomyces endolithicus]|nr:hypothetical protein LTR54_017603 [Friedmanniomyces endolithicus]